MFDRLWELQIPPQKMKLAGHYRMREIQPRHFEELAKACRYPPDALIAMLRDLSGQLPDEALALLKEVEVTGMARDVLPKLLDGLAAQCKATKRNLGDPPRSATQ
jgi:hypothetical protein